MGGRLRAGLRTGFIAGPVVAATALVVAVAPGLEPPDPSPGRPPPGPAGPAPGPTLRPPPPSGSGDGRLAGTSAGEGRLHPGRTAPPSPSGISGPSRPSGSPGGSPSAGPSEAPSGETGEAAGPVEDVPGEDAPAIGPPAPADEADGAAEQPQGPFGPVTPDPVSTRPAAARNARSAAYGDRVLRVLPLGTGLALTGLGLGFFALRLRRPR
ncbi:hypothetical protein [Streptomyces aureoversilis]|uniref:Secreted protein n=1 Tax=Streptomyces aureoversilis TaxID=67277 RepID=A0ABW0A187_9ACTN